MSLGGFLVSLLTSEFSIANIKKMLSFVGDRLNSKPIKITAEVNGKKIEISANSQKELEFAFKQAQILLESVQETQNNEHPSGVKLFNELEIKTDYYLTLLKNVTQFLENAGLTVKDRDKRSLYIVSAPENLRIQRRTTVLISGGTPSTDDIVDLVTTSRALTKEGFQQAGIFLYGEPPDPIVKLRIAEARLGSNFAIIPIPLAEVENALQDNKICEAVLSGYVNRYIQKADFFDDKNAISDAISFFGRIELLDRIKEELLAFQCIGLFGIRKSGKTSILYQLSFLLRKYPIIRVDLQQYPSSYYGAILFNDILQQIASNIKKVNPEYSLAFNDFIPNTPAKDLVSEFIGRVLAISKDLENNKYQTPILCFFDEVERILPTTENSLERAEEFNACFGAFRALSQLHRKLSILVTDVHPDCNRINNWKQENVATNPVFEFFKEIFLSPFSENETVEMLTGIGKFMGLEFDEESPKQIHQESGGHPFVSRQLTRFLSKEVIKAGSRKIEWVSLKETMERSLFEFDELDNYFEKSIWEDFVKRKFDSAISILKILAASNNPTNSWIDREVLRNKLGNGFSLAQFNQTLKRLIDIGIIESQGSQNNSLYRIKMVQFSRWIQMQMTIEEINQWQII